VLGGGVEVLVDQLLQVRHERFIQRQLKVHLGA
jgi:hypothetical protein